MMKKLFYTAFFLLFSFPIFSFAQSLSGMYEREKDFMGNPTVLIFKDGGKFEIFFGLFFEEEDVTLAQAARMYDLSLVRM